MNGLFFISIFIFILIQNLRNFGEISIKSNSISFVVVITILLIGVYVYSINSDSFYSSPTKLREVYSSGLFEGDSLIYTLLNLGFLYSMAFGILLPLSILGYFTLALSNNRFKFLFFPFIFLSSIIWSDMTYGSIILLPFISMLVAIAALEIYNLLLKNLPKEKVSACFIAFLFCAQDLPEFVVIRETSYDYMSDEESNYNRNTELIKGFNGGMYLSYHDRETPHISHMVGYYRMTVYSGTPSPVYTEVENLKYYPMELIDISLFFSGDVDHIFINTDHDNVDKSFRYDVLLSGRDWDDPVVQNALNYAFKGNNSYILSIFNETPKIVENDDGEWEESQFLVSVNQEVYMFYNDGVFNLYNLHYGP